MGEESFKEKLAYLIHCDCLTSSIGWIGSIQSYLPVPENRVRLFAIWLPSKLFTWQSAHRCCPVRLRQGSSPMPVQNKHHTWHFIFFLLLVFCLILVPGLKDNLIYKNDRAWDPRQCEQETHHRQQEPRLKHHVRLCCDRSFSVPRLVAQLLLILQGASVIMLLP